MPTLGFLKKKRTKDSSGPTDPSSPTSADAPALGGDTTSTSTSKPSNIHPQLSQTGSERAAADTVHASQRPLSQVVTHQQPPTSAPRTVTHESAATRSPNQHVSSTIGTYQTDGAGPKQGDHLRSGGSMTPAQAAAQVSSQDSPIPTTPQQPPAMPRAILPRHHRQVWDPPPSNRRCA